MEKRRRKGCSLRAVGGVLQKGSSLGTSSSVASVRCTHTPSMVSYYTSETNLSCLRCTKDALFGNLSSFAKMTSYQQRHKRSLVTHLTTSLLLFFLVSTQSPRRDLSLTCRTICLIEVFGSPQTPSIPLGGLQPSPATFRLPFSSTGEPTFPFLKRISGKDVHNGSATTRSHSFCQGKAVCMANRGKRRSSLHSFLSSPPRPDGDGDNFKERKDSCEPCHDAYSTTHIRKCLDRSLPSLSLNPSLSSTVAPTALIVQTDQSSLHHQKVPKSSSLAIENITFSSSSPRASSASISRRRPSENTTRSTGDPSFHTPPTHVSSTCLSASPITSHSFLSHYPHQEETLRQPYFPSLSSSPFPSSASPLSLPASLDSKDLPLSILPVLFFETPCGEREEEKHRDSPSLCTASSESRLKYTPSLDTLQPKSVLHAPRRNFSSLVYLPRLFSPSSSRLRRFSPFSSFNSSPSSQQCRLRTSNGRTRRPVIESKNSFFKTSLCSRESSSLSQTMLKLMSMRGESLPLVYGRDGGHLLRVLIASLLGILGGLSFGQMTKEEETEEEKERREITHAESLEGEDEVGEGTDSLCRMKGRRGKKELKKGESLQAAEVQVSRDQETNMTDVKKDKEANDDGGERKEEEKKNGKGNKISRDLSNGCVLECTYTPQPTTATERSDLRRSSFFSFTRPPRVCSVVGSFLSPLTKRIKGDKRLSSFLLPRESSRKLACHRHSHSNSPAYDHHPLKHLREYALINIPVEVALHPVIFDTLCTLLKTLQKLEKSLLLATTSTGTAIALGFAIPRLLQISGGYWSVQTAIAVAVLLIPLFVAIRCTYTPPLSE
ncbi:transmembrane protein [Cystoisospora suis]|uniref:Transmembrane protein n=1 Tax=Cystoisospora suis TaxID=483139 RepID=A0A2C6KVH9_9APIC|nr:transmembrane protein [Cystoisospora suis]